MTTKKLTVNDELDAVVTYESDWDGYRDSDSQTWLTPVPDSLKLDTVTVFGYTWNEDSLRRVFGDDGAEVIIQYIFEKAMDE